MDSDRRKPLPRHDKDNPPSEQPHDPWHGITLEMILRRLVDRYGWEEMGRRVPIRCFTDNPSLASSLKFLRRTPWARAKVERLYKASLTIDGISPRARTARRPGSRGRASG